MLNGGRVPALFAHGATRSILFSGGKLMLFSKSVGMDSGVDYFSSYLLLDFALKDCKTEFKFGYQKIFDPSWIYRNLID